MGKSNYTYFNYYYCPYIILYIYYKIEIHVENLLIIFGLIDSFQQPILTLCQTYSYYLISNVSTNRIEQYLSTNKKDKNKNIKEEKIEKIEENNIVFDKNEIIFIIGDTGCGKSYLLQKLFNNYKKNNNDYYLIYTGQEPFIMNDTIQSNIIFMKENKNNNEAYLKILNISFIYFQIFFQFLYYLSHITLFYIFYSDFQDLYLSFF